MRQNIKAASPFTLLALALSLMAVLVSWMVAVRVFERMAHIEDEVAYVWQAEVMAHGQIALPSPPAPKAFLVPFVVDYHGLRFSKYPPGWPAVLAIGVLAHARDWVNPLLAGLAVWLTYQLTRKLFSEWVAFLAALLTVTSPFFLMNSGSLLSHPLGLVLSLVFAIAWLDAWTTPHPAIINTEARPLNPWIPTLTAALSLGLLAITRPLTALGVALPFGVHAVILFLRGDRKTRLRLVVFGLLAGLVASLLYLWQYAVTGDPLFNPYTLWWKYDKVGFGVGFGRSKGGHTLRSAWINMRVGLRSAWNDLFGWPRVSWLWMPFGALALLVKRIWKGWLPVMVFPALLFVYLFYWVGSSLFGPRYYYEGLFSATILSAVGIAFLAGWPVLPGQAWRRYAGWGKIRPLAITAIFTGLLAMNLVFYLPPRLGSMFNLYGIQRRRLEPFQTQQAQALTPAVVIVHPKHWTEYGALLELSSPFMDTPWIFVRYAGPASNSVLRAIFPDRTFIDYYPSQPFNFKIVRK